MRRELVTARKEVDAYRNLTNHLCELVDHLVDDRASMAARLAVHENPNAPSSTRAMFNMERNAFRNKRGSRGSDGEGKNGSSPKKGGKPKKKGPPVGHPGISHSNKPTRCIKYRLRACPSCDGPLVDRRDIHKTVSDLDGNLRMLTVDAVQETGWCNKCAKRAKAPMPFLDGTSLGPVALGFVMEFYSRHCTDADIAHFFHALFWFDISASAIASARHAFSQSLDWQLALIKNAILAWIYAHMDETSFKMGVLDKTGWVWLATVPNASWVVFATGRTDAVLQEHFGWLLDKAVVADGLGAYRRLFRDLQRCWRHLLARIEEAAVHGGPEDVARYDLFLVFYRRIRDMNKLAPFTMTYLTREVRAMIATFPDGKLKTHLENAVPYMFTFLAYPGMPPHNNPAELDIRDTVVAKRNKNRQIATPDGRVDFSRLNTFTRTCYKNDILPCRAVVEMARDPKWDLFNPGPWTERGWCVFDSPPAALMRPPGPNRPAKNIAASAWPIMRALARPPDMDQLLVAVA